MQRRIKARRVINRDYPELGDKYQVTITFSDDDLPPVTEEHEHSKDAVVDSGRWVTNREAVEAAEAKADQKHRERLAKLSGIKRARGAAAKTALRRRQKLKEHLDGVRPKSHENRSDNSKARGAEIQAAWKAARRRDPSGTKREICERVAEDLEIKYTTIWSWASPARLDLK